jgi:hypothetical protein
MTDEPELPVAAVIDWVSRPASLATLMVVAAETAPETFWLDCTSSEPVVTEPMKLLPVDVVAAVVSLELVTTSSVWDAATVPLWVWSLETVL